MKICFVGLGSIGKRHIKNLVEILGKHKKTYTIDALRSHNSALPEEIENLIDSQYYSYDELPDDYDMVFITNPTSEHFNSICKMQGKTNNMFIEKPVFDNLGYNLDCILNDKKVLYVACPLRYTTVLQNLKILVEQEKIFAVRIICSSYLPDWRPNMDYRKTYSAIKALGGGVEIDMIHELDYMKYLLGTPLEIKSIRGKRSELEIDSNDVAVYIADYGDKIASIHLDYFGRVPRRQIELYTAEDVIVADLVSSTIRWLKSGKILDFKEERDSYQKKELEAFLSMAKGDLPNANSVLDGVETLRLALGEV